MKPLPLRNEPPNNEPIGTGTTVLSKFESLSDEKIEKLYEQALEADDEEIVLYGAFESNSEIQKYLEENGFEIVSSEFERIPNDVKDVDAEQRAAIEKLIERLEDDEDVQNVFHNMKEEEGEE